MPGHSALNPEMIESSMFSSGESSQLKVPVVPREWREVPQWWGLFATLRLLGGFVLTVAITPWTVLYGSLWLLLPLAPLLGVMTYKLTILMHDCSHKTLFASPKHNRAIGEICAGILATDFRQFTRIHWLHHQRLGAVEDPQRPDYVGLREAAHGRILWHLLRPLLGYNVFFKLIQYNIGKMIRSSGGEIAEGEATRPYLLPIIVAQVTIVALITGFGQTPWLVLFYPACAGTISLFLSQTRGFAEHVPPAGAVSETFVRTHQCNFAGRALFFPLHFNYHMEHHLHPSIPSYYLPDLHRLIGPVHHTPDTLSPGILATIVKRLDQARHFQRPQAAATRTNNAI